MHRKKCISEVHFLTSHGVERVKARKDASETAVISSRSQMIEACSESSFQPLLQFYLFLPTLLIYFNGTDGSLFNTKQSVNDWFTSVSDLQFWSILTSCISLAWSFNFYQSIKKKGALGFGSNLIGRTLLLVVDILQISSRLVAFVLFAYSWGDGNIWPLFLGVLIHIGCMSLLHNHQVHQKSVTADRQKTTFQQVYQSVLNGISNLYLWNLILPLPSIGNQTKDLGKESFQYQVIVDSIFIFEGKA